MVNAIINTKIPGPRGNQLAHGQFPDLDTAIRETKDYLWQSGTNKDSIILIIDGVEIQL